MDGFTAIGFCLILAAGIICHRASRELTRRQRDLNKFGVMTIMTGAMICMSLVWPDLWGRVGSLTWSGMTVSLIVGMGFAWRRFAAKHRRTQRNVNHPAPNGDGGAGQADRPTDSDRNPSARV